MGIIYCLENTKNGKIYVGQTIKSKIIGGDGEARYRKNRRITWKTNRPIDRAIIKYGFDCFRKIVLEHNVPENLLDERELFWQQKLRSSTDHGNYNCFLGSPGRHSVCEELKIRLRKQQTKRQEWEHPIHGKFFGSRHELKKAFPDENLSIGSLSQVSSSVRIEYKRWHLPGVDILKCPGLYEWKHEHYGTFIGKIIDLIHRFPEQKLNDAALGKIVSKNSKWKNMVKYRGWYVDDAAYWGKMVKAEHVKTGEILVERIRVMSRKTSVRVSSIQRCCRGIRKTAKKWKFQFEGKE